MTRTCYKLFSLRQWLGNGDGFSMIIWLCIDGFSLSNLGMQGEGLGRGSNCLIKTFLKEDGFLLFLSFFFSFLLFFLGGGGEPMLLSFAVNLWFSGYKFFLAWSALQLCYQIGSKLANSVLDQVKEWNRMNRKGWWIRMEYLYNSYAH